MSGRVILINAIAAELTIGGTLPAIIYGTPYSATLKQYGGTGTLAYDAVADLPAGITATDNGDGTITFAGTSTDSGSFPITVSGEDEARTPVTRSFVLVVMTLPITLAGDAGDMRVGDADTFSYGVSGGSGAYTSFAIGSGALPPGWTLSHSTGVITRAPTTAGIYAWTIVVTDSLGNVSAGYPDGATIFYPAITLTGAFASLGIIGVAYSSDITITGGDGIYSNPRFTSGAVSGMALSIVTVGGVKKLRLSGVPTTSETDSITVAVDAHDVDGSVVTATHSQSVTEDPALTLTGTFAASAGVGAAYQSDLLLGGGDGTFSLGNGGTGLAPGSGALPGGLALSIVMVGGSQYLRLSGNPTTASTPNFTVSVDSGDGQNVTSAQSMTIYAAPTIAGNFDMNVPTGVYYQSDLLLGGGDGTFALHAGTGVSSGALPAGLALSIVTVGGSQYLRLSGTTTDTANGATFTASVDSGLGQNVTSVQAVDARWYWAFFTAGEAGHIFDINDLSTLYQDTAHATPVTAAGQKVNAIRCKKTGLYATPVTATNVSTLTFDSGRNRYYLANSGNPNWMVVPFDAAFQGNTSKSVFVAAQLAGLTASVETVFCFAPGGGVGQKLGMDNDPTYSFELYQYGAGYGIDSMTRQSGIHSWTAMKNGNALSAYVDSTTLRSPTTVTAANIVGTALAFGPQGSTSMPRFYSLVAVNRTVTATERANAKTGSVT